MSEKAYLFLDGDKRIEIDCLLTTLKSAGIVRKETEFRNFILGCFYRGLWEYQKDLVREDC
jgi:hypothetical protein